MKKYISLITIILVVLTLFNGCTIAVINEDKKMQEEKEVFSVDEAQDEVESVDDESEEPSNETVLPVSDVHTYVVETEEAETVAPDGTVLATYSCSYPVFEANKGDDVECIAKINKLLRDNALGTVSGLEEEYEALVEEYENSKNYEYKFIPYEYDYDFEIHTNAKGVISFTEIWYAYLGGVHGMSGRESHTYDVVEGKELSLSDLLYGTEEEIIAAFTNEFLKVSDEFYPGTDPAEVVPAEFSEAQYYVDSEGVTAYFQEYHVGPYASGFISATVSDKEMLKYDFSDTEN